MLAGPARVGDCWSALSQSQPCRKRRGRLARACSLAVCSLLLWACDAKKKSGAAKSQMVGGRKFASDASRREEANRLFEVAQSYRERGEIKEAAMAFEEVAEIAYDNSEAQYHAGMGHLQAGDLVSAKMRWEVCLQIDPNHLTGLFNLATLLAETGDIPEARNLMEKVIALQPDDADNYKTMAILKFKQNLNVEAISDYMKCIRHAPLHADCYCGMGNSFIKIGRYDEAHNAYAAAVNINPNEPGYLNNVGNLLVRHHRFNNTAQQLAIAYLTQAIKMDGAYADGYFNLGEAYSAVSKHDEAMSAIRTAMSIDPQRTDYKCTLHLNMRKVCDWTDFHDYTRDLEALWQSGVPPSMADRKAVVGTRKPGEAKSRKREKETTLCPNPLDSLSYNLSLAALYHVARGHAEEATFFTKSYQKMLVAPFPLDERGRIRVGYVSIELRDRPVGKDMVYAFKAHDPALVSVECFSLNPSPKEGLSSSEALRWNALMVEGCTGGFFDYSAQAFHEAAEAINRHRPHVLINLDGWTSAPLINEIFILGPAPVQVNFKGYAGTTGVPEIHGLVADRVVVPPEYSPHYAEKMVVLPNSYHYNGHDGLYRHLYEGAESGQWPSRADLGQGKFMLDAGEGRRVEPLRVGDGPLMCNFNQFYKIVPEIWALWMAVLQSSPTATLWLLAWSAAGKASLQAYADQEGVGRERLAFSTFFEEHWHVAAKGTCDLFLDNVPYSAHGTAADALFTGLPILTAPGLAMAARVSTSLALASPLGSLLTARDLDDYLRIARRLASPTALPLLRALRDAARPRVMRSAAFDSQRWAASYVQALRMLWDAYVHEGPGGAGHPHVVALERTERGLSSSSAAARTADPSPGAAQAGGAAGGSAGGGGAGGSRYRAPPAFRDSNWRAAGGGGAEPRRPPSFGPAGGAASGGAAGGGAGEAGAQGQTRARGAGGKAAPSWGGKEMRAEEQAGQSVTAEREGALPGGWKVPGRRKAAEAPAAHPSQGAASSGRGGGLRWGPPPSAGPSPPGASGDQEGGGGERGGGAESGGFRVAAEGQAQGAGASVPRVPVPPAGQRERPAVRMP